MSSFKTSIKKLESSQQFKNFKSQNPDAELCAAFFVLDFETQNNQQQLDYILENQEIFTFLINNEIVLTKPETLEGRNQNQKLFPMNSNINIDLEQIRNIIQREMQKQKINKKLNKIIAILQMHNSKQIWNVTCMLEGFMILQIHINSNSGEILKFEKRSLFDFVRKK